MAIVVTDFPQDLKPIIRVPLSAIIRVLPDIIPFDLNMWLIGRVARDAIASENIIFETELIEEPSCELMQYFEKLIAPLGIVATVSNARRRRDIPILRIYNEGRKILGEDLVYREAPSPIRLPAELTREYVLRKLNLAREIPFLHTMWMTGSVVKNGFGFNDLDLIVGDLLPDGTFTQLPEKREYGEIRTFFRNLFGWKVDVGSMIMKERDREEDPVYLFELYKAGKLAAQLCL